MKNVDKFLFIYNDLKKYNNDFTNQEILQATKDLIKFSKQDYINKSFLKSYDNDNRQPLDEIFKTDKNRAIDFYYFNDEERDIIEKDSYQKFQIINNNSL